MFCTVLAAYVLLQTQAGPADDVPTSAQAQLAVAQSTLCQTNRAPAAQAPSAADGLAQAAQVQRAAHSWLDAWEAAGHPPQARVALGDCALDAVSALYIDALIHINQAHFDAAQTSLATALAQAPQAWHAGLRLRQGVCALHRHAPEQALQTLQIAQSLDPKRVAIRLATAQAYLALERPADTIACLRPLLSAATHPPDTHEIEQARALTGMAIEQAAGHISSLERTAMHNLLAMAQDDNADAQMVEMALSLAEAVPKPRVQTAAALVALKGQQVQAGRRLLKQACTDAALDPDPPRLLALYNVEHGGPTAALPCLTLAALRDPFNTETQTLIAELSERTQALEQTEQTLLALMRLEPEQARHKAAWTRLLARKKQHADPNAL